ncbi:MAG: hypothetical protein PHS82_12880 [Lachnospiraceae bacterium]|nr:hypothetical protein [Lachnospiraceae bacterium]
MGWGGGGILAGRPETAGFLRMGEADFGGENGCTASIFEGL